MLVEHESNYDKAFIQPNDLATATIVSSHVTLHPDKGLVLMWKIGAYYIS